MSKPLPIKKHFSLQNKPNFKEADNKMKTAAKMYEKQFLHQMVKAMRGTIEYSGLTKPTMAENIYLDKMYENYVDQWSESGGVGFAKVIYEQLKERFGPPGGVNGRPSFPIRPKSIPIHKNKESLEIKSFDSGKGGKKFKITPQGQYQLDFVAPWSGQVSQILNHKNWYKVGLQHDGGLQSTFEFKSTDDPKKVFLGQKFQKGEKLLSGIPSDTDFSWDIQYPQSG